MLDFCVSRAAGVRMKESSGSVVTGTRGLAFMIAATSAMKVTNTSWVSLSFSLRNMESRILLASPIILSHDPPQWDACGGLNVHVQPCSVDV